MSFLPGNVGISVQILSPFFSNGLKNLSENRGATGNGQAGDVCNIEHKTQSENKETEICTTDY